jgi:signal transduction histidine kinase
MARLEEYMQLRRRSEQLSHTLGGDVVFIKEGHERIKVRMADILYLEALNNYTAVVTPVKRYTVLSPISALLKETSFSRFVRIHRSFAVQKNFITRIGTGEVDVQGRTLPVGRTYDDDKVALDTDENILKTILLNLTANAAKALSGRSDGRIAWTARRAQNNIVFTIADNGPGVEEERLRALYDDTAVSSAKTGLGLHIIRDIARAIHIRIALNPAYEGGTEFILTFSQLKS